MRTDTPSAEQPTIRVVEPDPKVASHAAHAESPTGGFWRVFRRASVAGAAATLAIHLLLAVLAAIIAIHRPAPDRQGTAPEIGLAVMSDAELTQLQRQAVSLASPSPEQAEIDPEVQILPETLPTASSSSLSLTDTPLESMSDLGPSGGSGGLESSSGFDSGGAGGGGAEFFGVEAQGRRFIFIVDISGSMRFGGRIERLRTELIESVNAMQEGSDILILLFSDDAVVLGGGRPAWTAISPRSRTSIRRSVEQIVTRGGTVPLPAFREAFAMRPHADAIYFMTDGEFPSDQGEQIMFDNKDPRIPIHCIAFMSQFAEPMMKRIAQHSGGTYTYIP